jgi:hypothetical protein
MSTPTATTQLTLDFDYDHTTCNVQDTSDFDSPSGTFRIGRETVDYTGTTATSFTGCSRGEPAGDWRSYQYDLESSIGTWVTQPSPILWRGRIVELYAIPVDPYGGTHGADILSDAAMVWRGHIETDPFGDSQGWVMRCRSQDRRLTDPIGVEASGKGKWILEADPEIEVEPDFSIFVQIEWATSGGSTGDQWTLRPFRNRSPGDKILLSEARADFVTEWRNVLTTIGAPTTTYVTTELRWRWLSSHQVQPNGGGLFSRWNAEYEGSCGAGFHFVKIAMSVQAGLTPGFGFLPSTAGIMWPPAPETPDADWIPTALSCTANESVGALRVYLDEGDPADLPTEGYVIIEKGDDELVYEYTNLVQLADDGDELILTLAPAQVDIQQWLADDMEGLHGEFAMRFASKIGPDSPQSVMRQALLSSGRSGAYLNDATYDTEPRRAGYDLDQIATETFDDQLDEGWTTLGDQEILLDEEASFEKIWGQLLALSDRNVVSSPEGDGSAVKLRVVQTSLADAGTATVTIDDSHLLLSGDGSRPVRQLGPPRSPTSIRVKIEDVRGEKRGEIIAIDRVARDAQGESKWSLDVRGIDREALVVPVSSWAASRFQDHKIVRHYQLDVVPWLQHADGTSIEVGDAVGLDLSHYALWDPADGSIGYTGPARVLGKQTGLRDYGMRLIVGVSGIYTLLSLAPSAEVLGYTGAHDNPATIDVHQDYYTLMGAFRGGATFDVVAYRPSFDDASSNGYLISDVQIVGGNTRMTVSGVTGSFSLATGTWYVTIPVRSACNARKLKHLHNDTPGAAWS